jgi:putative tricarboxylic transport membrane protein
MVAPHTLRKIMNLHSEKSERLVRWLVPLALILFAVVAIYISTTFKKMPPILKRGIQPSDFPRLICGLIIFLSLLMAWFDPVKIQERVSRQTFLTVALVGMFVLLVQVDLFIALGAFAAALSFAWGERRIMALGLVGLVMPVVIFFIFDLGFRVRFPRGLLTNMWYG